MRTTVNIHDGLLATVKHRAQEEGKTLGDVFEDALRSYLLADRTEEVTEAAPPSLPVFRGGTGLAPGIDPSSNASLYEAMYAAEDAALAALIRGHERP
ncbi:CopG family transcriptional regulator [Nocardioides sp. L-11A]|uniref:CopG family transcriptional regulator n=1 Tax=Nocardioides sp. L-11A TaxID=3043848 RepID=UPI00249B76C4|nr:CopG family transcriptional regulator [Nocardioides sp. L-11A]